MQPGTEHLQTPAGPLVYAVLSLPGSGASELITDLQGALTEAGSNSITLGVGETLPPPPAGAAPWDAYFITLNPEINLADSVEELTAWLEASALTLTKFFTVLRCDFFGNCEAARAWIEAALHFSDAMLLNNRGPQTQKWQRALEVHVKKTSTPCLLLNVKKNRAPEPALLLHGPERRITQIFDALSTEDIAEELGLTDAFEGSENGEQTEGSASATSENDGIIDLRPPEDPYLKRSATGARSINIPQVYGMLQRYVQGEGAEDAQA